MFDISSTQTRQDLDFDTESTQLRALILHESVVKPADADAKLTIFNTINDQKKAL